MEVDLSSLTTNSAGELNILGHDSYTLGVNGTQVGVLEEANEVSLRCFLESHDGGRLEPEVGLEILGNLPDKPLERKLANKELGALLVTPDFTKSYGTGPVPVGFLNTAGCWGALSGSLGGELLPRRLSSGRFTCSLLCTSHFDE